MWIGWGVCMFFSDVVGTREVIEWVSRSCRPVPFDLMVSVMQMDEGLLIPHEQGRNF